ncbi:thermonuclease family protein [Bernardetia sp. ABR2-2B]|uniref:thermonuclease family protein n=1 Tax=Bernardetia sp. ABR2-2B TaxID=3127472 RepID=UPI0030D05DE6
MEEPINYVLYGSILGALLIVVIILLVFRKKIMLFLLTNFSDKAVKTTVLEVLEGDTIVVEIPKDKNQPNKTSTSLSVNDESETSWTVRLIGVDTPESRASLYIDEAPFGKEALAYTEDRFNADKNIILVFDEQLFDKFEKHLAYIYFPSGECLNATLLKEGYGWIRNHAFTIKFAKEFGKLQEKARTKQKGIWNMYVTKGILREEYKETEHYKEYKKRVEENE